MNNKPPDDLDLGNIPIGSEVIFVTGHPWIRQIGRVTSWGRRIIVDGKDFHELIVEDNYSTFKGCSILDLADELGREKMEKFNRQYNVLPSR